MIPQEELDGYRADYAKKKKAREYARDWYNDPNHPERAERRRAYQAAIKAGCPLPRKTRVDAVPVGEKKERTRGIKQRSQKRRYEARRHDTAFRVNQMFNRARRRAREEGLPFTITRADLVVADFCPVLGIKMEWSQTHGPKDGSPSLDKMVPALGYVPGNVVVISHRANRIKTDANLAELRRVVAFYADKLPE